MTYTDMLLMHIGCILQSELELFERTHPHTTAYMCRISTYVFMYVYIYEYVYAVCQYVNKHTLLLAHPTRTHTHTLLRVEEAELPALLHST